MSALPELLVFARPPLAGRAKTRLQPAVGAVGAARVHGLLARNTLAVAASVPGVRLVLCAAAPSGHPFFAAAARRWSLLRRPQPGGELGRRMDRALRRSLVGGPRPAAAAVLIGTDLPGIAAADLQQAFTWLAGGADAVLGPAADGGYWLIGLRRPAPGLFRGLDWGSDRVTNQTRRRLRRMGLSWRELPPRADLDRPAELLRSGVYPWRGAFSALRSEFELSR